MFDDFEFNKVRNQLIINVYGKAIMVASELNNKIVEEFGKNIDADSRKELWEKKSNFYHLLNKFDIRLLPYDKCTIREAIESLMKDEIDAKNIEQLKIGLIYLDDFIDFSQLDS